MARLTSRSTTSSMTPLQSQSTLVLAQRNAATATVSTRRGASKALSQRRSLMQAYLRARARAAAARQQRQTRPISDTMAFQECRRDNDIGMEEGDGGVGR
jgi:hypothetical protein